MDPCTVFTGYDTLCSQYLSVSDIIIKLGESSLKLFLSKLPGSLKSDAVEDLISMVVMMIVIVTSACAALTVIMMMFMVVIVIMMFMFVFMLMIMLFTLPRSTLPSQLREHGCRAE